MSCYKEAENNLIQLIQKDCFSKYIETIKVLFQQADSVQKIEQLLVILFQLELKYKICKKAEYTKQYKDFLDTVKEIILYLLSQGIVPNKEYIHLYNIYNDFDFEEDGNIVNLLDYFKEDIKKISSDSEDKFTEIYIIFLLEILNGNEKLGLEEYLKNILLTNIHVGQQGLHCRFIEMFSSVTSDFDIEIVLETFKFYLTRETYTQLSPVNKKSLFAWGYELLINISKFTKNSKNIQLYPYLKDIIDIHINNNVIEELMYTEFFTMITQFTVYQKSEEFEKFNNEITYRCSEAYQKVSLKSSLLKPKEYHNKKKKIAFVFERLVEHSPFKVVLSLLQELQKNKDFTNNYEVVVYSLNYFLPLHNVTEIEKSLTEIGVKVIYPTKTYLELDNYSSRIERAITVHNHFIKNKVDILVACLNSYDILNFIIANQSTNKQVFWSHNHGHYDVIGINQRISHFEQKNSKFDFQIFNVKMELDDYNTKRDSLIIEKEKKKFPKGTFILGTIGRLIKIDSKEYLETVASIMKQNPNTIYLACGVGNNGNIKKEIKKHGLEKRFYFCGFVDPHIYGHVLDLWLEPFPLGNGESLNEYAFKKKLFIKLYKYSSQEKQSELYETILKYIWVETLDEYIDVASKIINNSNFRKSLIEPLFDIMYEHHNKENNFLDLLNQ